MYGETIDRLFFCLFNTCRIDIVDDDDEQKKSRVMMFMNLVFFLRVVSVINRKHTQLLIFQRCAFKIKWLEQNKNKAQITTN